MTGGKESGRIRVSGMGRLSSRHPAKQAAFWKLHLDSGVLLGTLRGYLFFCFPFLPRGTLN
jgi:hypothetical protein